MKPAPPVTRALIGADPRRIGGGGAWPAERPCYPRRPMRLIVTEKNNSAEKIADHPQQGRGEGGQNLQSPLLHLDRRRRPASQRRSGSRATCSAPPSRGLLELAENRLHDLIDAELIKEPTDKNVVKAIRKGAKKRTSW
jgi:hypothetical protein